MILPFSSAVGKDNAYYRVAFQQPLECWMGFMSGARVDYIVLVRDNYFDLYVVAGAWYHFFDAEHDPLVFSVQRKN